MDNATQQAQEAVDAMAPITRTITGGGKEYQVQRLETRQVWPILRCGLPIIEGLTGLVGKQASSPANASPPLGAGANAAGQPPNDHKPSAIEQLVGVEIAQFLQIMADHGEHITEIVAVALDETIAKVGRFEPQETYLAIKAIVEVNRDFFSTRVAPILGLEAGSPTRNALAGAVAQATKAMQTPGDGETHSSN